MVEQNRRALMRDRLLLGLLYGTFFVVVFIFSAYWTFPYDRARSFVASALSAKEAGGTTRTVEIGELEPAGLGGVRVGDLAITQIAATQDQAPITLKLSEATAKLALFPLLFGDKNLTVNAVAGTGTLDAKYEESSDSQRVEAELNALDVSELGLGSWIGLPLKGKASGHIEMNVPTDVTKATGSIKLEIRGLKIGDGKAKIKPPGMPGGLTLDEVEAGKLELAIEVRDGIAKLTRLSTDGKDLKLTGSGNVRLADPLKRSRPDISLELTFTDAYKSKSDRTKAMFDLLQLRPEWQRATTPDGTMHVHVGGTFLALRAGPGR
jgi:type II secretion system protein N